MAGVLLRLLFAASIGLGVDESYVVAADPGFRLGYFDHPPAVWWLSSFAAHLAGTNAPVIVRLPFILLFALSTWLMYRLGAELFSPRAGLFAAIALNLSPLFGVAFGTFVLPDGPLDVALLAAALFLAHALEARGRAAFGWWLSAGLAAGFSLFSKYTAVLGLAGAFLYLLTSPRHRRWLSRIEPWLAALLAFFIFLPTLIWNAEHHWTSFAYQGDRALGFALHPLAPFIVFGGEALFLLPWIWLPLVLSAFAALRRGPGDWRGWLLLCLAAPAVLLFSVVALWAEGRILFHWAAPGYLMLFPLLGAAIDQRLQAGARFVRPWLIGTTAFILLAMVLVATEVRLDWPVSLAARFPLGRDPALQLTDWHALRTELSARHLLDRPGLVIGTVRWSDAAKIAYALGPHPPVIVLGPRPHEFGLAHPLERYRRRDVLVLAPNVGPHRMAASFGDLFARITPLAPLTLRQHGRLVLVIPLYLGHALR
ncbi:MAG: glycosyltransferase family 39 protein [Rhodospirillales bacterium]|nr:glycosyltransferase family 39 protein [Rhodospirillales bacterium]